MTSEEFLRYIKAKARKVLKPEAKKTANTGEGL
jgi:hypothetical protein